MIKKFLFLACCFYSWTAAAQNLERVNAIIESLCSPQLYGRGYVGGGDSIAAAYIASQCRELGMEPIEDHTYFQAFDFDVNTFPGSIEVMVDNNVLKLGEEFIVAADCPKVDDTFPAVTLDEKWFKSGVLSAQATKQAKGRVVVIDGRTDNEWIKAFMEGISKDPLGAQGYVVVVEKLTWFVSRLVAEAPVIYTNRDDVLGADTISLWVDQVFKNDHTARNVVALMPGERADSVVVFSAHFDHLGGMGRDVFIAGANDNASGTAMLLDLAAHYRAHPPKWNTVFMFFAGEEAGLLGSKYYVNHPFFPLERIRFLINLDLMGDAGKGITAVNGKVFNTAFETLKTTNSELGADSLLSIQARGKAANSDHYPFTEMGVPAFFIYTRGEYTHYHDVHDVPENLPMTNYNTLFELITRFAEKL